MFVCVYVCLCEKGIEKKIESERDDGVADCLSIIKSR